MTGTKSKHRSRFLTSFLLTLNFLTIILLVLSYTSYHFSPELIPIIAFAGLAYPFILGINLILILIWIFINPKYIIVPLIVILLGWNHIGRLYQFFPGKLDEKDKSHIHIVSYNVQNFLKVNTSSTKYVTDFKNETKILEFLKSQKAELFCLQEVLNDRTDRASYLSKLAKDLNITDFHYRNYFNSNKKILDALVIFTKYPIIKKGHFEFDEKTIGIFTDLLIEEDTVRLYNLHLASIHFKKEDYEFWSEFSNQTEKEEIKTGTLNIIKKMKNAFIKRSIQADILSTHMAKSPYPVIVCGDFNDTPTSYTYNKLAGPLKDAFVTGGKGFGITYAGEFFPAFRIDYILHDPIFHSTDFKKHDLKLSDHYPLSCKIILN